MKSFFCYSFFINLLANNCFALIGGSHEYNANFSSVVLIERKASVDSDFSKFCTGVVMSATLVLTSTDCLINFNDLPKILTNEIIVTVYLNVRNRSDIQNATKVSVIDYRVFDKPRPIQIPYQGTMVTVAIEYFPHDNLYVFKVSPAIDLEKIKITPARLSESDEYPESMTIVGYGVDDSFYRGNLNWIRVTNVTYFKGLFDEFKYPISNKKKEAIWQTNKNVQIDDADIGAAVFDKNYYLVGLSHSSSKPANRYVRISPKINLLKIYATQELNG